MAPRAAVAAPQGVRRSAGRVKRVARAGTAGTACGAGEICDGGQCVISCPGSLIVCDDTCVNPNTDRNHCGATEGCGDGGGTAGQVCDWDQICLDGVCTKSCPAGLVGCGGDCIDPDTSDDYCGASGNCQGANAGVACQADEYCSEGACLHENCRRHGGAIWCGYDGLAANKSCGEICQRAGMTISHDASVVQGINDSLECEALAAAFGVPKLDEVSVEPFTHTCALVSGAVIYCSTDPNCVSKLDETPGSGVAQFICPCEQP